MTIEHTGSLSEWLRKTISKLKSHLAELGYSESTILRLDATWKELMTMQLDKIEDVLSENLGEGYRIVRDNDELSPIIEWVDWVNQSENDENEEAIRVEVHFEDGTEETFEKGITLRQIWHEDVL